MLIRLVAVLAARARWLLPLGGLLTLAGYFGPWVNHRVAALVVTGLDLGEYVKFLPAIRNGDIVLWRQGFYLPLIAVSLTFSLVAFRHEFGYAWPLRALCLSLAVVAALNMLPPAWTPARLVTPEFRQQTAAILLCLAAVAVSPLLALLPLRAVASVMAILCALSLLNPLRNFLRLLPDIALLYNRPLQPGWGFYVISIGLLLMLAVHGALAIHKRTAAVAA